MPAPRGNQNAKGNKGGGRKSAYQPKFAAMAEKACQAGFTDRELAELLGVSEGTINAWKLEHVEFAEALKNGKAPADERVERSLYHKAIGYTFESEKIFNYQGTIVRAPYSEHVPPDTVACIFWLKNRRPDLWRDRVEHTGKDGGPIAYESMSDMEVARRMVSLLERATTH